MNKVILGGECEAYNDSGNASRFFKSIPIEEQDYKKTQINKCKWFDKQETNE